MGLVSSASAAAERTPLLTRLVIDTVHPELLFESLKIEGREVSRSLSRTLPTRRLAGTLDADRAAELSRMVRSYTASHPPVGFPAADSMWADALEQGTRLGRTHFYADFGRAGHHIDDFIVNEPPAGWSQFARDVDSFVLAHGNLHQEYYHQTYKTWLPY